MSDDEFQASGSLSVPFTRLSIDDVLRADADGMPVFRHCFEFERLLSFYDDDGALAFDQWWDENGKYLFGEWCRHNDEFERLVR